jgi:hypothetical protein
MPLELWILVGLGVAAVTVGIVRRLGGLDRREHAKETKNVYPLW